MSSMEFIITEADQLAEMLINRPEIEAYQAAEARMIANPSVVADMRRLKEIQEQIGDFMSRNVPEAHYQHLQTEMESLLSHLEQVPEVAAFISAQSDVTNLIQAVTERLSRVLESPKTSDGAF